MRREIKAFPLQVPGHFARVHPAAFQPVRHHHHRHRPILIAHRLGRFAQRRRKRRLALKLHPRQRLADFPVGIGLRLHQNLNIPAIPFRPVTISHQAHFHFGRQAFHQLVHRPLGNPQLGCLADPPPHRPRPIHHDHCARRVLRNPLPRRCPQHGQTQNCRQNDPHHDFPPDCASRNAPQYAQETALWCSRLSGCAIITSDMKCCSRQIENGLRKSHPKLSRKQPFGKRFRRSLP